MRTTYPSLLLLSLVLASCGGGGDGSTSTTPTAQSVQTTPTVTPPITDTSGGTPTPTTPTTPTPNNTTRVIEYYGDSTVYGYTTGTNGVQVAVPAPKAFDEALPATPAHTVSNQGVSGTDACQLLNGTDGEHPRWEQQMAASTATHVIVNHAINDQGRRNVSDYKSCLTALARIAKQSGKQIIFETPNPITGGDIGPFADAMREVAAQADVQAPVIDQFTYLSTKYQGQIDQIVPDGLHPTAAIYIEKGQFAAQEFQKKCGNFTCTP